MQTQKSNIRDNILKAAQGRFATRGYQKTSMRDIATEAGVGVGNVYNRLSADFALTDQIHTLLGYDFFHADKGQFAMYDRNSEVWIKLKYSF